MTIRENKNKLDHDSNINQSRYQYIIISKRGREEHIRSGNLGKTVDRYVRIYYLQTTIMMTIIIAKTNQWSTFYTMIGRRGVATNRRLLFVRFGRN